MNRDLVRVSDASEVRSNVGRFAKEVRSNLDRARNLTATTTYWVFDSDSGAFGPGKFVGFKDMTFPRYDKAHADGAPGDGFDGGKTHRAIEAALRPQKFYRDLGLGQQLAEWLERRLGANVLSSVDQSKWRFVRLEPTRRYWAFFGNPRFYLVDEAVDELERHTWTVKDFDVHKGDHVLIWRGAYRGRAGVIALGEVETDPQEMLPAPDSLDYIVGNTWLQQAQRRVWVRIIRPSKVPLWLDEDRTGLLKSLSVARARGGTVFHIKPDQWSRLVTALGGLPSSNGRDTPKTPDPDYRRWAEAIDASDQPVSVKRRTEQHYLRKHFLRGASEGPCSLCGLVFPVQLLVAAHVKRRAACSPREKGDTKNVVPMCRFGCDELFERGYVCIVGGKVSVNERALAHSTPPVRAYLERLALRACSEWDRARKYFEWHAKKYAGA